MRRQSEFTQVTTPSDGDFVTGYRPGAKGIRIAISDMVAKVVSAIGSGVTKAFGQSGTVTRLFLVADDSTRHEVKITQYYDDELGRWVYGIGVDQNHTPEE